MPKRNKTKLEQFARDVGLTDIPSDPKLLQQKLKEYAAELTAATKADRHK